MQKVIVRVVVDTAIGEKDKRLNPIGLLAPVDGNIILNKLEHIDVSGQFTSFHLLVIEAEHADKFLENDVVLRHDLLTDFSRETHHFSNDVLQLHVLYQD